MLAALSDIESVVAIMLEEEFVEKEDQLVELLPPKRLNRQCHANPNSCRQI